MEAKENVYALRGATTVEADRPELIDEAVKEMLETLYRENGLTEEEVAFTLFSMTSDLRSRNAAAAARRGGYCTKSPLFCVQEAEIDGMLPCCIRVMILINHGRRSEAKMAYLRGAAKLRPDLKK